MKRVLRLILAFTAVLVGVQCRVDDRILYDRSYKCDPGTGQDTCGTGADGQTMVCFAGDQLGGTDICADRCDPAAPAAGGSVCLSSGAKLSFCRPDQQGGASSCPVSDQSCLRTDVLSDEGVCTVIDVCSNDSDCPASQPRTTCLASLLRGLYGTNAGISADHLSCLVSGCIAEDSTCPLGEVCLPKVIPPSSGPPDICVPKCDANLNCPPNYFCYRKISGPQAPDVCIPGILGFGCTSDLDCLMGTCVHGDGFGVCSLPCASEADCLPFSYARGPFVCLDVGTSGQKYCLNPNSFVGASCAVDADCPANAHCKKDQALPNRNVAPTECRFDCAVSTDCPTTGGFARSCVNGSCYPGRYGVPCTDDGGCISDLHCLSLPASDASGPPSDAWTCSFACTMDADCTSAVHVLIEGSDSLCIGGTCRRVRQSGVACDSDVQCSSHICVDAGFANGVGTGHCQ